MNTIKKIVPGRKKKSLKKIKRILWKWNNLTGALMSGSWANTGKTFSPDFCPCGMLILPGRLMKEGLWALRIIVILAPIDIHFWGSLWSQALTVIYKSRKRFNIMLWINERVLLNAMRTFSTSTNFKLPMK